MTRSEKIINKFEVSASDHYIKKCSCGIVVAQCRCPSENKKVIKVECPKCSEGTKFFIEIAVRDAQRANIIMNDRKNISFSTKGSNYFTFPSLGDFQEAEETFHKGKVEILSSSDVF